MDVFASAKGKQQKEVRQLQCQEQGIDHIPYYLSGLSRALFFPTTFLEVAVYLFWEQPFYENYSTWDSHTNTVISHAILPTRQDGVENRDKVYNSLQTTKLKLMSC